MHSRRVLICLSGIALLILFASTAAVAAEPAITEQELKAVVSFMEANQNEQYDHGLVILDKNKISLKRLQRIMKEIAMVMPYIETKKTLESIKDIQKMDKSERARLESARETAKGFVRKYFEGKFSPDPVDEKDIKEALSIYEKFSEQIQRYQPYDPYDTARIPCF
jgi:hypothetical protein